MTTPPRPPEAAFTTQAPRPLSVGFQSFAGPRSARPPKLRLVCLPFAGTGTTVYRDWAARLAGVEVIAVRLPGRESRMGEARFREARAAARAQAKTIAREIEPPFALFGHSMGALLAYEVTCALRQMGATLPERLIVSARSAPDVPIRTKLYLLPDAELARVVESYGATPQSVLESPWFRQVFLPLIRDDFEIAENYTFQAEPPLPVPITALGAAEDPLAPFERVLEWKRFTTAPFEARRFSGQHFFIRTAKTDVLQYVAGCLGQA